MRLTEVRFIKLPIIRIKNKLNHQIRLLTGIVKRVKLLLFYVDNFTGLRDSIFAAKTEFCGALNDVECFFLVVVPVQWGRQRTIGFTRDSPRDYIFVRCRRWQPIDDKIAICRRFKLHSGATLVKGNMAKMSELSARKFGGKKRKHNGSGDFEMGLFGNFCVKFTDLTWL